jgi:Protein of unknown function (DUF2958)
MSKLLPEVIAATLPALYATENDADPTVHVKFFTPDSSWSWLMTEYSPEERRGFGLVIGFEAELGYFSLDEMEKVRGPLGLAIERDLDWKPQPLSQCRP